MHGQSLTSKAHPYHTYVTLVHYKSTYFHRSPIVSLVALTPAHAFLDTHSVFNENIFHVVVCGYFDVSGRMRLRVQVS